ncbi:MAG: GAF domain-containing protein, partial [Bacteroidales bacterium]|nr:GAF domain-containing protein [Bacteroidales bacterium]
AQKGEIVISNDVPNDPRKKGLPKGHPPINSYLAIPIQHNNEVIGVISLANRKEGYSYELVKELEVIWNSCAQLIYAYRNKVLKKEADRKLKESEEKLSNFIDQNPASIFFIRFKKPVPLTLSFEEAVEWVKQYEYIEDCNDAAAIGWGYSDKNDLVGKSSYHLLAENDEVFRSIMHAQYYNNWKVKNEETKETNTNGETVYFMNSSFLIIKDNHVHGLNMVSVNITENKKLEKEIKSIKDKLTKFIETIPSSIYFIDLIKPMPLALSNDE